MALPIGLQLFTVRDPLKEDFEGTLKQVADIGYTCVELAGLGGQSAEAVRQMLGDLGLKAVGAHAGAAQLKEDASGAADDAKVLGYTRVGVASPGRETRRSADWQQLLEDLKAASANLGRHGLKLYYHNHAMEFDPHDDGPAGFEVLFDHTDASVLECELDIGWAHHGGRDVVELMRKLTGRLPLLHVKDLTGQPQGEGKPFFAEVGTGVVDIAAAVGAAESCGVEALVVEQDRDWIDGDAIASARISFENLTRMVS
jgi:sugar phosphate isomerase/epimerase